jgi:hypothetical protein
MLYYIGTQGGTAPYTNPHTAGYITVTVKSLYRGKVDDIVNKDCNYNNKNDFYYSNNSPDSWIMIDLGSHCKANIKSFDIRHYNYASFALKNCELSVSNSSNADSNDWVTIFSKSDNTPIYSYLTPYATAHINCNEVSGSYRYIRLKQTGPNSSGGNQLILSGIELYGDLTITPI